ncbi:MAG TPA: VOC family protein [Oceanobacillus sp.]|nr:VOC family protein [Oceanobacillus sp.]
MTYFADLSPYKSKAFPMLPQFDEVLTVGWLQEGHEYPKGEVGDETIAKLNALLESPKTHILRGKGFHECDLCTIEQRVYPSYKEREIALGSAELWVPAPNGVIYAAPTLIIHYIEDHGYRPPDEFIEAVKAFDLNSDWDGNAVVQSLVEKYRAASEPSISKPTLNLIVLRTADIRATLAFYRALGMVFVEEQHGTSPVHYSCELGDIIVEIYPTKPNIAPDGRQAGATMIGFRVESVERVVENLRRLETPILTEPQESEWGRRAVVQDPDGRAIELNEPAASRE